MIMVSALICATLRVYATHLNKVRADSSKEDSERKHSKIEEYRQEYEEDSKTMDSSKYEEEKENKVPEVKDHGTKEIENVLNKTQKPTIKGIPIIRYSKIFEEEKKVDANVNSVKVMEEEDSQEMQQKLELKSQWKSFQEEADSQDVEQQRYTQILESKLQRKSLQDNANSIEEAGLQDIEQSHTQIKLKSHWKSLQDNLISLEEEDSQEIKQNLTEIEELKSQCELFQDDLNSADSQDAEQRYTQILEAKSQRKLFLDNFMKEEDRYAQVNSQWKPFPGKVNSMEGAHSSLDFHQRYF